MKDVKHMVLSIDEYEDLMKNFFGESVCVDFSTGSIFVGFVDADDEIDEAVIYEKLVNYFDIKKVLSVWINESDDFNIWIEYE